MKSTALPRPFYFLKRLVLRFLDDDISALSAESTYYFILGLIPFLIFFANALLFFAAPQVEWILRLLHYLPSDVATAMEENIFRILQARSSLWMTAALLAALWTSSQGVDTLIRGMDHIFYGNRNTQSYVVVKGKSLIFTIMLSLTMIVSLVLMVFGNALVYGAADYFTIPSVFLEIWVMAKYGIPFVMIALSLAVFYYAAPAGRHRSGKKILTSAFLTTFLWIGVNSAYGYYILHISSMGLTYGSLIGMVVLFLWFHLTAMVILLGGEMMMAWEETIEPKPMSRREAS